eukprot:Rhum_TRINITY_DN316_c0_g1::Rhum_TRINITY_DN316_c0_g1_i1::g.1091::m.1091
MATMIGQRVTVHVSYLTSTVWSQTVLHYFMVVEEDRGPQVPQRKRLIILADRATYLAAMDYAINRVFAISLIKCFSIFDHEMADLRRSRATQYDVMLQSAKISDFVRIIGAVFRPNDPHNPIPVYELEEKQPISEICFVRESSLIFEDATAAGIDLPSNARFEEVTRRMLDDKDAEITELRSALDRQKEQYMLETVDLQNRVSELQYSLSQNEQLLRVTKQNSVRAASPPPTVLNTHHRLQDELDGYGHEEKPWVPVGRSVAGTNQPAPSSSPQNRAQSQGYHSSIAGSNSPGRPSGTTTINIYKKSSGQGAYTVGIGRR